MTRKRPKNLLLSAEALNHGEEYAGRHGTTLSRLVEDYLLSLPALMESPYRIKSVVVAELYGRGILPPMEAEQQRDFLERWRRRRGRA